MPDVDIAILGAGIAGLTTAHVLHRAGRSVRVLEARAAPGGRVRSARDAAGDVVGDLGPTWIWPEFQPIAAAWLDRLGLESFAQFDDGLAIVDVDRSVAPAPRALPAQVGSLRLRGGTQALIDRLVAGLPAGAIATGTPAVGVEVRPGEVAVVSARGAAVTAAGLVVAVPPRIAHGLAWQPRLPAALAAALAATPTWMAPHAKAVIRYDHAFWRARGWSGRIASRVGPIVEAHDHCGPDGTPAALFGFVGWPRAHRQALGATLADHIAAQLARCFGRGAPAPLGITIEDWAADPWVAVPADLAGDGAHPDVGPDVLRQAHFDGRVWFAAAETAEVSPGLIEGALAAGERVAAAVQRLRA